MGSAHLSRTGLHLTVVILNIQTQKPTDLDLYCFQNTIYRGFTMVKCKNLYLLVLSADKLCKQFGTKSGSTKSLGQIWIQLFDTLMVFLKEFFEKVDLEKICRQQKSMKNYTGGKGLMLWFGKFLIVLSIDFHLSALGDGKLMSVMSLLIVLLKEIFENVHFEKSQQTTSKA